MVLNRRRIRRAVIPAQQAITGLAFANNTDLAVQIKHGLEFVGAALTTSIANFTIGFKTRYRAQTGAGYYTNFFDGRSDGGFLGDNTYVGAHPYNNGLFEISAEGGDETNGQNGHSTAVTLGQWLRQSFVCRAGSGGNTISEFFYDHAAGMDWFIRRATVNGVGLVNSSISRKLVIGENYWSTERGCCDMRGMYIVNSAISAAHMAAISALDTDAAVLAYCTANSITLHYLNSNPTPSDISDKSGAGHHPQWMSATKPGLWQG